MADSKSVNAVSVKQAGISFGTIAGLADTVHRLCVETVQKLGDPEEDAEALVVAARDLAAQIGLIADTEARALGAVCFKDPTPAAWLQPPIYHEAATEARAAD